MTNAARSLTLVALLASLHSFAACSMPNSGYEESQSASTKNKIPPPWMEIRDYEPEKPYIVENVDDVLGDLPRANFKDEILTKDATSGTYSLLEWDTPPKNQGSRPWCTAFAQVTVMENMIRHGFGEIVDLSEIHHFRNYNMYDCYASTKASQSYKIIPESSWPYNGSPVSGYKEHGVAKITGYRNLTKMSQVKDAIRANHPVHIGLDINYSWNSPGKNGRLSSGGGGGGGHAITIVGFYEDSSYSGGGYFLIKNSWGTKWGDMGYGRVPYDYCNYGSCVLLETLGVEYKGTVWDGSTVPPPPPPSGDDPTVNDLQVVTIKNPTQPNKFTLQLVEKKAGALTQVVKVNYNVHETFGTYATWMQEDPKDGFKIPFEYTTYFKGRWMTNGAAVYLKSGKTLNLPGAPITWYYVD
jgi:hypothetical protein